MNRQTAINSTNLTPADEDTVIKFMREMRKEFGAFEYRAVSPRGTVLTSPNWHRVRTATKVLPLFLPEEPVGGGA